MRSFKKNEKIVGIDEVGRGPLAGPVAVGVVLASECSVRRIKKSIFFTDSKKMKHTDREKVFEKVDREKGKINYVVSFVSAERIDRIGINPAIYEAVKRSLQKLGIKKDVKIFLDGGLKAPRGFSSQKAVKGGDATEDIISLASVLAKVKRDRRMIRYDKVYSGYGFSLNKGYGTKKHIETIKEKGITGIHRKSFLKNILS